MKITSEMLDELNKELENMNLSFRYKFNDYGLNPSITITPINMSCIDSFILNVTNEFYAWLEVWFKNRGIELIHNNTRSTFWSKNGWNE